MATLHLIVAADGRPAYLASDVDRLIAELHQEIEAWQASFTLYDDAMRRATKTWQEQWMPPVQVWPDAAALVSWMLDRIEHLERIAASQFAAIVGAKNQLDRVGRAVEEELSDMGLAERSTE